MHFLSSFVIGFCVFWQLNGVKVYRVTMSNIG